MPTKTSKPKWTKEDLRDMAAGKVGLAETWLRALLHADATSNWASAGPGVVPAATIGRRKRLFAGLLADGYAVAGQGGDGHGDRATSKAWDEIVPETPDLLAHFRYDRHDMRAGHGDAVVWDRLTLPQKKAVVLAAQADPASYTFAYRPARRERKRPVPFLLGGGAAAREATGWDATLVVSSPALRAAAHAAARADYKDECLQEGLNWYLRKLGAIDPADGVVLAEKTPLFLSAGTLPRRPEQWPAAVPAALAAIDAEVAKLAGRKAVLLRLADVVATAGGWDQFLAAYDAAVDGHVAENTADYLPAEPAQATPAAGG